MLQQTRAYFEKNYKDIITPNNIKDILFSSFNNQTIFKFPDCLRHVFLQLISSNQVQNKIHTLHLVVFSLDSPVYNSSCHLQTFFFFRNLDHLSCEIFLILDLFFSLCQCLNRCSIPHISPSCSLIRFRINDFYQECFIGSAYCSCHHV